MPRVAKEMIEVSALVEGGRHLFHIFHGKVHAIRVYFDELFDAVAYVGVAVIYIAPGFTFYRPVSFLGDPVHLDHNRAIRMGHYLALVLVGALLRFRVCLCLVTDDMPPRVRFNVFVSGRAL